MSYTTTEIGGVRRIISDRDVMDGEGASGCIALHALIAYTKGNSDADIASRPYIRVDVYEGAGVTQHIFKMQNWATFLPLNAEELPVGFQMWHYTFTKNTEFLQKHVAFKFISNKVL